MQYYEIKWLLQTEKLDLGKARIFSNIFRFIDYLCTLNNDEFESNFNNFYADEMELKKENKDSCKSSLLGISTEVHDRKPRTQLFDQRAKFPVHINHMSYLDSNVPSNIFHASIDSEILRITRTTTDVLIWKHMLIFF